VTQEAAAEEEHEEAAVEEEHQHAEEDL